MNEGLEEHLIKFLEEDISEIERGREQFINTNNPLRMHLALADFENDINNYRNELSLEHYKMYIAKYNYWIRVYLNCMQNPRN